MGKKLILIGLVLSMLFALGAPPAMAQPTYQWKMVGTNRATPQFEPFVWFAEEVEKRTNGQIKVDLTSLPELGLTGFELVRVLKAGLIDGADVILAYIAGDVPIVEGVDLPGLYPDFDASVKAHDAFLGALRHQEDKIGGIILGGYLWPHQVIWSRKPIRSLDDLKGMKVRVYGTALAEFLNALGAIPVSVAFAEVYTALERGTVDAAVTGTYSGYALKWYEVSKYMIELNIGPNSGTLTVSKRSWDKLTPELQATLRQMGKEFTQRGWEVGRRTTQEGIDKSREKGIEFINPGPKFLAGTRAAVLNAVIPGWAKRAGPDARPVFNEFIAPSAGFKMP